MPERLAVITGASSGLGATYARRLGAQGWNLRLLARREEKLSQLAAELGPSVTVEVEAADLADPHTVERVAARLAGDANLELLINNAGFGTKGYFWQVPIERQREMHQLHIMTTMRLCHAALQGMVARNRGGIINVASVAAYIRSVGGANYCASKSWMKDFTEGLWLDLRAAGADVTVQALCPGFTYTEFHDTLGASRDPIPKFAWLSAERVVDESLAALESRELFVIPSFRYRAAAALLGKLPSALRLGIEQRSPHAKTRVLD